ncbi:hypothetical protein [Simkania sp.]|uniref:hypothetical protein n=1 Tax=Simkania sp. TaxID=34094 RepID=UPI003B5239A9
MAITTEVHRFTAEQLTDKYRFICHGPNPKSFEVDSKEFTESQLFEEVELNVPVGVDLTEVLIRKVMLAWIDMNVTNQFLVRAMAEMDLNVDPSQNSLYETFNGDNKAKQKFDIAFSSLVQTKETWDSFAREGYSVTIIK